MIVSVWLTHKPGEPRIYTTTVHPTKEQLNAFKRDGFTTFEAKIILPVWDDVLTPVIEGVADPVTEVCFIHDENKQKALDAWDNVDTVTWSSQESND